jgi:hypothetical protein
MNETFQNSAQVISIGIFFTLMILGLSATLPRALRVGLAGARRPGCDGCHGCHGCQGFEPAPVFVLFSALLGYNPAHELLGPHVLSQLSNRNAAAISGRGFFPHLIAEPFYHGLHEHLHSPSSLLLSRLQHRGRAAQALLRWTSA